MKTVLVNNWYCRMNHSYTQRQATTESKKFKSYTDFYIILANYIESLNTVKSQKDEASDGKHKAKGQ